MDMKCIATGSSGNCSFLQLSEHSLILFDLGISYKKLVAGLKEHAIDIEEDEWEILVLVTHGHGDHWKPRIYKMLEKRENLEMSVQFPQEEFYIENKFLSIQSKPFKHGDIFTNFFIVTFNGKRYGYLTDVNGNEMMNIILWEPCYNLDELFIESNHDSSWYDYVQQANLVNGYSVDNGFERHLNHEATEYILNAIQPKEHLLIHQSSRFKDRKEWENE